MKVKDLKNYIKNYKDDVDVVIKGSSGITWDIVEYQIAIQILTDTERKVCKLHIK